MSLILNLRTRHIYPQYHVVFDDNSSTVPSRNEDSDPPPWWNIVDLEESSLRIHLDEGFSTHLDKYLLIPEELKEMSRLRVRTTQLHRALEPTTPNNTSSVSPSNPVSGPISKLVHPLRHHSYLPLHFYTLLCRCILHYLLR